MLQQRNTGKCFYIPGNISGALTFNAQVFKLKRGKL